MSKFQSQIFSRLQYFPYIVYPRKVKNQQYFLVNSNKISICPYLNEKSCWGNLILVHSTKHFSGWSIVILTSFPNRNLRLQPIKITLRGILKTKYRIVENNLLTSHPEKNHKHL